jgi:hypothetical protein
MRSIKMWEHNTGASLLGPVLHTGPFQEKALFENRVI